MTDPDLSVCLYLSLYLYQERERGSSGGGENAGRGALRSVCHTSGYSGGLFHPKVASLPYFLKSNLTQK